MRWHLQDRFMISFDTIFKRFNLLDKIHSKFHVVTFVKFHIDVPNMPINMIFDGFKQDLNRVSGSMRLSEQLHTYHSSNQKLTLAFYWLTVDAIYVKFVYVKSELWYYYSSQNNLSQQTCTQSKLSDKF